MVAGILLIADVPGAAGWSLPPTEQAAAVLPPASAIPQPMSARLESPAGADRLLPVGDVEGYCVPIICVLLI